MQVRKTPLGRGTQNPESSNKYDAQVTRLCRAHRLHSALAFLFNRALGDYTAPAAELLLAFVHAPDESPAESASESAGDSPAVGRPGPAAAWGARRATGYKLLVYLHCCLSGRAFPPGRPSIMSFSMCEDFRLLHP